jgi:hypothetical protein
LSYRIVGSLVKLTLSFKYRTATVDPFHTSVERPAGPHIS